MHPQPVSAQDQLIEANFDSLVGPTHNFAGLSPGNVASLASAGTPSSPRAAALQGLDKAWSLAQSGVPQYILPPQPRPNLPTLARMGFSGPHAIADAARDAPHLLAVAYSASSMWTANAATVAPSTDTADARLHLTPANLFANTHRALEARQTTRVLREVFDDNQLFCVHDPLPATPAFADEGAANHTRLAVPGRPAVHLFAFGRDDADPRAPRPRRFSARQTKAACQALARLHKLDPDRVVLAHQHPEAIDAGVFHNDVISVGHADALLIHEHAYINQAEVTTKLRERLGADLTIRVVLSGEVPFQDAVASYLFNAQLLGEPHAPKHLLCPRECESTPSTRALLDTLVKERFLASYDFADLDQSMRNGGGPACLRLRIPMTERQAAAIRPRVRLTQSLYDDLGALVRDRYAEALTPDRLADPAFADESLETIALLADIFELRSLRPTGPRARWSARPSPAHRQQRAAATA